MRYYALYNNGKLVAIGTGSGGTEITETEYNRLLTEIRQKADLVDQVYRGVISINNVPDEWRVEIQRRVNARKEADAEAVNDEVSPEEIKEALEAIL